MYVEGAINEFNVKSETLPFFFPTKYPPLYPPPCSLSILFLSFFLFGSTHCIMFLKKIRSKLGSRKYNTSVRSNHGSEEITKRNPTPHSPPTARVLSATTSQQPTRNERRDLWREALEILDDRSQERLRIRGMSGGNFVPMEDQLEALKKEAERQCERCKGKEWKVSIGRYEIPVRQTTIQIISWVIKIGDVAGEFPPAPGRGVWAVVRSLLEVGLTYVSSHEITIALMRFRKSTILTGRKWHCYQ